MGEVLTPLKSGNRANKLTALFIKSVSKPGKYHDGGGTGLYLRVDQGGAKFWVQRITVNGKRRELGLGSPPVTTLAHVRETALENKVWSERVLIRFKPSEKRVVYPPSRRLLTKFTS